MRSNTTLIAGFALVVAATGVAACFSDRATTDASNSASNCTAPSTTAGATVVFIQSFTFFPATVHVRAGQAVAWVNCEPTPINHTSTSDGSGWNSGQLAPKAAFVHTFAAAGSFPYHCDIHPSMRATVIVD